ncbi:MAG: hypothetical protein WC001_07745 [Desulfurivibrionaceae bacterium]
MTVWQYSNVKNAGQPKRGDASPKNAPIVAAATAWSKKKKNLRGADVAAVARRKNNGLTSKLKWHYYQIVTKQKPL